MTKKLALLALLLLLAGLFFSFDLGRYLTLDYLKESQGRFQALYADHRIAVIAIYMVVYIVATGLSLPGAAVLTLAGGGFFGLFTGTLVVSFASTLGATLACFAARTLLRDWVQGRFGEKLTTFNEGINREGWLYLFTLRLIPIFPFFIINLVMGLTTMRLSTYYWVSQLGMLPATIVYVNAGKELAKLDSLSGILSPTLLLSFALLGIFPLAVKRLMQLVKAKVVNQR
jgi:uncharacterized membrane protein YdjX (TVP38/TMEM64 family)